MSDTKPITTKQQHVFWSVSQSRLVLLQREHERRRDDGDVGRLDGRQSGEH